MNKTLRVASREYLENLTTKTFWIGIISFPIILSLALIVPMLLEKAKDVRTYAVIDHSDWLAEAVQQQSAEHDLRLILERVSRFAEHPERLPSLYSPAFLQVLPALTEEDPATFHLLARYFASDTPQAPLSERLEILQAVDLVSVRDQIRTWFDELTTESARKISKSLRISQYQQVAADSEENLNDAVNHDELFAYFVIPEDPVSSGEMGKYVSNNFTDQSLKEWFAGVANSIIRQKRFDGHAIDPGVAASILAPVEFELKKITEEGEEEQVGGLDLGKQWVPVALVYLLWISVFSIAQMLLTNTVEEKSNRIIEVLLSSVSPLQLMYGKIFGIAATGLTVIASWIGFIFLALKFLPGLMGQQMPYDLSFLLASPVFLVSFAVYFLLGYLFYAALLVGMGAVCNSLKEAQNLMSPVTIILLVPLLAMVPVGQDPNGMLAKIMSYIPPFTPFVMMNRAAGPPSGMEYVVTSILLLASIVALSWAAAKVFRIGILMTGKPPKLREILQWIRTPVGAVPHVRENGE